MYDLPVHPAAEIFPMMDADSYADLRDDIQKHGLLKPLVFFDGKLIDGRNRLRAVNELEMELQDKDVVQLVVDDDFDPVAYVLSINLHRRHLTTSQRAMIAARCKGVYEEQAKQRQTTGDNALREILPEATKGRARDKAGEALKVSGKTVDKASKVLESEDPELIAAVDNGELTVSAAASRLDPPREKPDRSEAVVSQIRRLLPEADDKMVVARDLFDSMDSWQRDALPSLWSDWLADVAEESSYAS